ncbi:unnamed protein product [Mytilus edulis]|uniref:YqaJ viral recombinase domain-containing protein n=1 Tax=Mytilus edulis TaxID=6550 RepID=A0A8S3QC40_MYTED|nr:unnamed protein product [Mytilus edulis]
MSCNAEEMVPTETDKPHKKDVTLETVVQRDKEKKEIFLEQPKATETEQNAKIKPAQSLIKSICHPSTVKFTNKATRWGCDHEKTVRQKYVDRRKDNHEIFEMKDSGLVLNSSFFKFPYLGASPDGIANCDYCGDICIEIKCPYRKRDVKLDAALDKRDCLEMRDGK